VHQPDERAVIYCYPESLFPPADFQTATLMSTHIYALGGVGYYGARHNGHTPVYRLNAETFAIEKVECTGIAPGWIYDHVAKLRSPTEIKSARATS
jgi:hypothetical protein